MTGQIAILILRLAFGGMFFYSGILKLQDPIQFLDAVRGFRAFEHLSSITGWEFDPSPWEAWVAMGLPWLELLCGTAVLIGIFDRGALAILCSALALFTAAIISAWSRGLDIACGCFGEATPVSDYRITVAQRIAMLAVGVFLLIVTLRQKAAAKSADLTQ